jgi:hypothetical protein
MTLISYHSTLFASTAASVDEAAEAITTSHILLSRGVARHASSPGTPPPLVAAPPLSLVITFESATHRIMTLGAATTPESSVERGHAWSWDSEWPARKLMRNDCTYLLTAK